MLWQYLDDPRNATLIYTSPHEELRMYELNDRISRVETERSEGAEETAENQSSRDAQRKPWVEKTVVRRVGLRAGRLCGGIRIAKMNATQLD